MDMEKSMDFSYWHINQPMDVEIREASIITQIPTLRIQVFALKKDLVAQILEVSILIQLPI